MGPGQENGTRRWLQKVKSIARRQPNKPARPQPSKASAEAATETQEFASSPLPSPETLRAYDEVVPGTARRIVDQVESDHEAKNKSRVMRSAAKLLAAGASTVAALASLAAVMVSRGRR